MAKKKLSDRFILAILIILIFIAMGVFGYESFAKFILKYAIFVFIGLLFIVPKLLENINKEWKKKAPSLIIQIFVLIIIGNLIVYGISDLLKPQTDIDISCEISLSSKEGFYEVDLTLDNKANFAGKNFRMYVWNVISGDWGSGWEVDRQCEHIDETGADRKRFHFYCDFIPPNTEFNLTISNANLTGDIIETKHIRIDWWGETTPYKEEVILCKYRL